MIRKMSLATAIAGMLTGGMLLAAQVDGPAAPDTAQPPRTEGTPGQERAPGQEDERRPGLERAPGLEDDRPGLEARDRADQRRDQRRPGAPDQRRIEAREQQRRTEAREQQDLGLQLEAADDGLTVTGLQEDAIAADIGLREGDVIVDADGRTFTTAEQFENHLLQADQRVPITVLRNGRQQTLFYDATAFAQPGLRPGIGRQPGIVQQPGVRQPGIVQQPYGPGGQFAQADRPALGVLLQSTPQGVLIVDVMVDGPADQAGLEPDDLIVAVNDRQVNHVNQFLNEMSRIGPEQEINLQIARDGQLHLVQALPQAYDVVYAEQPDEAFVDGRQPMMQREPHMVGRPGFQGADPQLQQEIDTMRQELQTLRQQIQQLETQVRQLQPEDPARPDLIQPDAPEADEDEADENEEDLPTPPET